MNSEQKNWKTYMALLDIKAGDKLYCQKDAYNIPGIANTSRPVFKCGTVYEGCSITFGYGLFPNCF